MPTRPRWLVELLDEEVGRRIRQDPRTIKDPRTFLGCPKERVFWDAIGGGQTDFDAPIGHLSGEDRALLYAKYNQPRHLDELGAAFEQLLADSSLVGRPTVIDLGCGPFTAGLALAATLGPDRTFRYYGVDRAAAMRSLGSRFASAANALGGLHDCTTCWFGDDLDKADFGSIRGDLKVVVASYLLASPSLNVDELLGTVLHALERIGPGPTAVLYTNSAEPTPNAKYPAFRDGFCRAGFEVKVDEVETFSATKNPKKLRYALFFKEGRHRGHRR